MKSNSLKATITTALFGVLSTMAVAQVSQNQLATTNQDEDEEERPIVSELTIGATSFGSDRELYQYASPFEGFGLHSLRYLSPLSETSPFMRLILRGMPDQDNLVDAYGVLNEGRTAFSFRKTQYSRTVLDWKPTDQSSYDDIALTIDHAISPNLGAFLTYHTDKRGTNYPAPRATDQTRTQTLGGGVGGQIFGGNAGVSFTDRRTYDGEDVQPDTSQQTVNATYTREMNEKLTLGGVLSFTRIEQVGNLSSDISAYKLTGLYDAGPQTDVQFQFSRLDSDMDSVMNAYVRKRLQTNVRLVHRLPGWTAQLAYNHNESERVRSDQSYADVPKTNGFDLRLSGKLGSTKVKLRGSWENVSNDAVMLTDDPRQLYWGDRATYQARFERGNENYTAYGSYTYRLNQNDERDVEIGWHNVAFGGSYVFNSDLYGYMEVAFDDFQVEGKSETGVELDDFFPNAKTFALGAGWSQSPELSATVNLNFYESGNVRGTQLTCSIKRILSTTNELEVVVAPWNRKDQEFDLNTYHSTFLSARFTTRF